MLSFREIGVEQEISEAIEHLGFKKPTPIQKKTIPLLLEKNIKDIIALAQTGTGKTAAFGIPLLQKCNTSIKKIQFLIISPTRELCLQIADDIKTYAKYKPQIKITAVFGGAGIDKQIKELKKGTHIVSATPGRLVDLINRKKINLSNVKVIVLDEADEMLNMGFRDELDAIVKELPNTTNTLLFSATMPKEVLSLTKRYMKNPLEITIGEKNSGAENVNHIVYFVHARNRYLVLKRIVDFHPAIYGIIFCRTRKETKEVADKLIKDGYNADAIHGDLSQAQRDAVMNKFRIKHLKLLVATDVASRGLDVSNLSHIINYNLPDELEVYTHRSGRTGRAGNFGTSVVIANLHEKSKLKLIEKKINKKFEVKNIPLGKEICEQQLFYLIDKMEKVEVNHSQIDSFLPFIMKKLEWLDREELIKKFVSLEFNRFLDYYKDNADLTEPFLNKKRKKNKNNNLTRFFLNLGKTDKLTPVKVIGMLKDYSKIKNLIIGNIDIMQNFSFIEAETKYTEKILKGFENKKIKNRKIVLEIATPIKNNNKNKTKRKKLLGQKRNRKKK